jgi:hypothetical protein
LQIRNLLKLKRCQRPAGSPACEGLVSGTVDVDDQGLGRERDALQSFGGTVREIEITFGEFGSRSR